MHLGTSFTGPFCREILPRPYIYRCSCKLIQTWSRLRHCQWPNWVLRLCRCGRNLKTSVCSRSPLASQADSAAQTEPSDAEKWSKKNWQRFLDTPEDFLDVRATKTKDTQPDFKLRWAPGQRPGQRPLALWLNDRFLPAFVKPLLQELEANGKAVQLSASMLLPLCNGIVGIASNAAEISGISFLCEGRLCCTNTTHTNTHIHNTRTGKQGTHQRGKRY